nr:hypothetical protein [Tanacetum cinerariifolium]
MAMDEVLIPSTQRLWIGRSNFRLPSDIQSKESTLQLVYDVLRRCPFFKAFLVTADINKGHHTSLHVKGSVHPKEKQGELALCQGRLHVLNDQGVSRHQNTQQYGAMLPIELTNDEIRNTKAYKEYYAFTTGEAAPKPKASAKRKRSGFDTSITPPTVAVTPKLTAAAKGKQLAKATKAKSPFAPSEVARTEAQQLKIVLKRSRQQTYISQPGGFGTDKGTGSKPGVPDVPTDESEEKLSWNSSDDEGVDDQEKEVAKNDDKDDTEESGDDDEEGSSDEEDDNEETKDEESFNPIPQTSKSSKDKGDGKEDQGLNIGRGLQASLEIEDSYVTLTLVKLDGQQESSTVSSQFVTSMLNPTLDAGMESIFETASTSVAPLPIPAPPMTHSTIATITTTSQVPILPTPILSEVLQNLPTFALVFCFNDRLKSLEENLSEVMQTNQFAGAVFAILRIVQHFMDQRMNKAVQVAVQIQSDRLCEEAQKENDEFLRNVDENIKKIIKVQVKEQANAQVSKILPRIKLAVNEQLEAEVLTRSSHSSRTCYAVAADLSEMELKKILIEKMEGNKSIQRSDAQRNLYKALVDAYESDKIILDTYEETVTLKRRRDDDEDKDEEPSAGPDRGSKRRREGKEPESASTPSKTATKSTGRSITGSRSRQASTSESAFAVEPVQTTSQMEEPSHPEFETELLARPTYKLMKWSCKSLIELEYHLEEVYKATTDQLDWVNPEGRHYPHNLLQRLPLIPDNRGRHVIPFAYFINKDLEYLRGGASSRKYTTSVTKIKAADYRHIKWIKDLVPRTMWIQDPIDYDKHALRGVSHWGRKRKLSNLTIEERFAFNVSLRMFTRSIVIQRRVEDLHLGVESYQKRLNLTKLDTYWSDLKRREAYTAYSNPRGFIYQNKDKKNRLMWIDELHKFSDGTLNNVRTALDDRLKGIRIRYLPQTIWRKSDKDRAAAMIQAIDKMFKTKRVMRSLERFVGGRLYEGDFKMLQRTI